jgi:hypothetical protein
LLLMPGLNGAQLPNAPAANGNAGSAKQQGQYGQAVTAAAIRRFFVRWIRQRARLGQYRFNVIFWQDCFAHVSILCI